MRVEISDVSFAYDPEHTVLDDTTIQVSPGEVVSIMGPSGVGKSTLLFLIGGLLAPDHGAITWDGTAPDYRRADLLTWVPQTVNVLGMRSARDNVMLGLYATGLGWRDAWPKASQILERMGLGYCLDRKANDLSGGELQRIVIARALVGSPSLVLADEPTGQLDAASSKVAIDCLVGARHPSTTVIFATHDPLVAANSHRVFVLEEGKIRESNV